MQAITNIAIWNANGVANHKLELEHFLQVNFIDILLISESHLNSKSYFNVRGYNLVCANHPDDKPHGGAAILIKSTINYEVLSPNRNINLQAANIKVKTNHSLVTISDIYYPPRFSVSKDEYKSYFEQLGTTFIAAGDFNAKHPWWGSRLTNPKGRPTYWPTDPNKMPDLIDFVVFKGIPSNSLYLSDCTDLSSDHSPLLLAYNTLICSHKPYRLVDKSTHTQVFQDHIDQHLNTKVSTQSTSELEDSVESFTNLIHEAAYCSTPRQSFDNVATNQCYFSSEIRQLIAKNKR